VNLNRDDLLEEGLARIAADETEIDAFLTEHPHESAELGPLLEAARAVRASVAVDPDPNFTRLARAQFAAQIQVSPQRRWWQSWSFNWSAALRPVALAMVTVVAAGSVAAGGVAASQESLPGEPLYGIKRAEENARLIIVRDDIDRASFRARLVEVRLRELRRLDDQRATQHGDDLAQEVAEHMRAVAIAVEQDRQAGGRLTPETRAKVVRLEQQLKESTLHDPELMQTLAARIPPARRPFMARILRAAQEEYERTMDIVEPEEGGEHPAEAPARTGPGFFPREGGPGFAPPGASAGGTPRPAFPFRTPPAFRQTP